MSTAKSFHVATSRRHVTAGVLPSGVEPQEPVSAISPEGHVNLDSDCFLLRERAGAEPVLTGAAEA